MIIIYQTNKKTNATACLFLFGALCQSHQGEGGRIFSHGTAPLQNMHAN